MAHKTLLKTVVAIVFLLAFSSAALAQNGTIKGIILDVKTNEPLIGASILIDGTTQGAAADLDGNFVIPNVSPGTYSLTASYVAYQTLNISGVVVESNKETELEILMTSDDISLEAVEVVARANRESENILLLEQRKALVATQAVGARELSRKGIGDAQAAVAQVAGISRQEGVKNVFVRGLGDRYNATLLNGFPIPSEDPEYKNIALEFFGTDVIQNIGVNKVFSGNNSGDVGGAIIDITSKELFGDQALGLEVAAGLNSTAFTTDFLRQDGSDYFGFANNAQPSQGKFDFKNSLDPSIVKLPLNHSFGLSGGKSFRIGENSNPLSFFVVASHNVDYSYTKEIVRNSITNGLVYQDQEGKRFSQNTNQLVLGNVNFGINRKHNLQYNFMMIHANDQYVGEYAGKHAERHQDSEDYMGFYRRQQTNDNLLITNQVDTDWELSEKLNLEVGASYNTIKGLEPDRRENYLSRMTDGSYILTGSNRQKRFFSTLNENDINAKTTLKYKLNDRFGNENSSIRAGYVGRFVKNDFNAVEYNFSAVPGTASIENLQLDDFYNTANLDAGKFQMTQGDPNSYEVTKNIHSGFAEGTYQLTSKLLANVGFRVDKIDLTVDYVTQNAGIGSESINKFYYLPSANLKYDVNDKNVLRLGLSKTYTLPQSKEISPYQYVNIGFASQGNPNIKPSDNYNADLKWDYYLTPSELISLTGFYKIIQNPIGRADQGNSAGLLEYTNISDKANVAGMEVEVRKNIFSRTNASSTTLNRLSVGVNASYIYSNLVVKLLNTEERNTQLEGAAPFIGNFDISHTFTNGQKSYVNSLVLNYFSNRIHTIGSRGFKDIIEKGIPTLDFVSSAKLNQNITLKLKATNLLNPNYTLTREASDSNDKIVLNQYKKGINVSLGISYDF
ncbi:MAG: TonB-dependent receptor [Bacteroidia bacterium]|nr:TonB-dependent receptor [Bacteroidia bacterium]